MKANIRINKISLSREDQINIARRHMMAMHDARNTLSNVIGAIRHDLNTISFDIDLDHGIGCLCEDTMSLPAAIDTAMNESEINDIYLDDEIAEIEQDRIDDRNNIEAERCAYHASLL